MMATMSAPMTPPNALASRPPSAPTTIAMSQTSRIVPKTCQPLPLTSSRLRPKAARMPGRSTTVTGTATDQIVSRIRPGMMMRTNPIATPMPNRIDTTITGTRTGVTLLNSSPSEAVAVAVLEVAHEHDDHAGEERGQDERHDAADEVEAVGQHEVDDELREVDERGPANSVPTCVR